MSPTQKTARKPAGARARATKRIHARFAENDRLARRVSSSVEVAQKDLGKLGGSVGSGVADLRKNLTRLLRDARRDTVKLSKATRKDLERLQKDLAAAARTTGRKGSAKAGAKKPAAKKARAAKKTRAAAKARSTTKARTTKSRTTKSRSTSKAKAAKPGSAAKANSRAGSSRGRATRAGR